MSTLPVQFSSSSAPVTTQLPQQLYSPFQQRIIAVYEKCKDDIICYRFVNSSKINQGNNPNLLETIEKYDQFLDLFQTFVQFRKSPDEIIDEIEQLVQARKMASVFTEKLSEMSFDQASEYYKKWKPSASHCIFLGTGNYREDPKLLYSSLVSDFNAKIPQSEQQLTSSLRSAYRLPYNQAYSFSLQEKNELLHYIFLNERGLMNYTLYRNDTYDTSTRAIEELFENRIMLRTDSIMQTKLKAIFANLVNYNDFLKMKSYAALWHAQPPIEALVQRFPGLFNEEKVQAIFKKNVKVSPEKTNSNDASDGDEGSYYDPQPKWNTAADIERALRDEAAKYYWE